MKKSLQFLVVFFLAIFLSIIGSNNVSALESQRNPIAVCNNDVIFRKPYERLVVVDLTQYITNQATSEAIQKQLFYELVYIKERKVSPFNAIMTSGDIVFHLCDQQDVSSRIENKLDTGDFVLGIFGTSSDKVNELLAQYNLQKIVQADIIVVEGKYTYSEVRPCDVLCSSFIQSKDSWQSREYKIAISKVSHNDSVKQRENLKVSVFIENQSQYYIYSFLQASLHISPKVSSWYMSSWISPSLIVTNVKDIVPTGKTQFDFELNTPIVPGKYSQEFDITILGKKVAETFPVTVTVQSESLQLATIRPRDNLPFARVRESQTTASNELFKLDSGEVIIIEKDEGAWLYISTKDARKGWMYRPNIRFN